MGRRVCFVDDFGWMRHGGGQHADRCPAHFQPDGASDRQSDGYASAAKSDADGAADSKPDFAAAHGDRDVIADGRADSFWRHSVAAARERSPRAGG